MTLDQQDPMSSVRRRPGKATGVLMALAAVSFGVASTIHSGVDIPLGFTTVSDSFDGAVVPEAVIGAVMAIGAVFALGRWARSMAIAVGATAFAIVGTCVGLRFTLIRGEAGDLIYHFTILTALLVILAGLLTRSRRTDVQAARTGGHR